MNINKHKRYKSILKNVTFRIFQGLLTILFVSFFGFFAITLAPGNPAELILGHEASPDSIAIMEKELGLDLPILTQYFNFLKGLITMDLGISYRAKRPISEELFRTVPISFQLATIAVGISSIIGIIVGTISAVKRGTIFDDLIKVLVLGGVSLPVFWLCLLLIYFFAMKLHLFPSMGWGTLKQMVLPCIGLSIFPLAYFVRFTRTSVLEVIRKDFVRTALAKGLPYNVVLKRHILKNALLPIITVIGLQYASLMAGAIMVESVFNVPGLGSLLLNGLTYRDYPIVRTCIVLASIFIVIMNLIIDLLYSIIDPRISF